MLLLQNQNKAILLIHSTSVISEKTNQTKNLIRKVDIDKGKQQVQRFQEIELPHSPIETPSKLSLEDASSWNM